MKTTTLKRAAILITWSTLLLNACDEREQNEVNSMIPRIGKSASEPKRDTLKKRDCVDRFEVLRQTPWMASHLALNTSTGQMCRTWDWEQASNIYRINRVNCPTCDESQHAASMSSPNC